MPDPSTLAVLRALARGVDPATGEALPADHLCQQATTVRALCAAVAELESRATHAAVSPSAPAPARSAALAGGKAGQRWDAEEDAALAEAFDQGVTLGALARRHERSRGAVEARLVKLGKLEAPPGYRFTSRPEGGPARDSATAQGGAG